MGKDNGIRERIDAHERRINDHEKRMRKIEQKGSEASGLKTAVLWALTMFAVYVTLALSVYAALKE